MTQSTLLVVAALGLVAFSALLRAQTSGDAKVASPLEHSDDAVRVKLQVLDESTRLMRRYVLVYGSRADTTRVAFAFAPTPLANDGSFAVTRGTFASVNGSHAEPLLHALAVMHGSAPVVPKSTRRTGELAVDVGILGVGLTLGVSSESAIAGSFSSTQPGPWTVLKLFFPSIDAAVGQPELYLALNEAAGEAQFLWKNPDYWPTLSPTLASVLIGQSK